MASAVGLEARREGGLAAGGKEAGARGEDGAGQMERNKPASALTAARAEDNRT